MTTPLIKGSRSRWLLFIVCCLPLACGSPPEELAQPPVAGSWSITAWGERFEIYPEVDDLVVGKVAVAHTHVTRLADFSPLAEGSVEVVLVGSSGEQVFSAHQPDRPGVFAVEIVPQTSGEFDLLFRIHDDEGSEEIRGGRILVGTPTEPGSLLRAPAPRGGSDGGEPLDFLKEQQWKSTFDTGWVRQGRLARSIDGMATFRPPAGGESTVTASISGIVQPPRGSRSWPFVGLGVKRGAPLFRVVPLVAAEHSLASLEAEQTSLANELETARTRHTRLEELLALEATSQREVEEIRAQVKSLEAQHSAAAHDLEAARSGRQGGSANSGLPLKAPFAGEIAAVHTTPGTTVEAGEPLARLVRTDVLWIEVAVSPKDARKLASEGIRGIVLDDPESGPTRITEDVRLVSIAPELSPRTGTVNVLLETPPVAGFILGSSFAAQILSANDRQGIVVPSSAVVDDGGVSVVYLQLAGESFVRQEITILERQGTVLLVDQLTPGQRLVTRGGNAIRRSSLMASGAAHGHVH